MKKTFVFCAALLLSGCTASSFTAYKQSPPYPGNVIIYDSRPQSAELVGIVEADGLSIESVIRKAKAVAAKNGATGIVFKPENISRSTMYGRYGIACEAIRMH